MVKMLKRSHRDIDLPSLAPPAFAAASEARKPAVKPALKRSAADWDSALLSAYMVESEAPRSTTAGLGMGLEIVPPREPQWSGSWSSHCDYMKFIYGGSTEASETTPQPKRQRVDDEDDIEAPVIDDGPPEQVVDTAREFAAKTTLRRGFFASALKRQLEALRQENARLKTLAMDVLDEPERANLFSDLGSEQSVVVDSEQAALSRVVEHTRDVVASENDVNRRDLALVDIIQSAQRAFVVTNPNLTDNPIVWCSDEFCSITGYERSEVCGRNCRFLQGPKTNPKAVDAVRRAINDSHEASVILLNYRKDGSTFWNRFFIAPLRDARGEVTFYVGVQTNVSASVRPGTEPPDSR